MDPYTRRTREWLEAIYEGPPGVPYTPHSPVHGFDPLSRYIGTYCHLYAVLSEIARYEFDTCLEVGSGEGFAAAVVRRLFGVPVVGVDLSLRVCRRAHEFVQLACAVGEGRQLPLRDESVDLVVSINTLEHIADVRAAYAELRRVARGVLVIGLPHAVRAGERESDAEPHAHVSMLTRQQMQGVFGREARLRGSLSRLVRPLYALAARDDVSFKPGYEFLRRAGMRPLYALVRALGRRLDARRAVAALCRLDDRMSRRWPAATYETLVVCELAGGRRRQQPLPPQALLAELLR